MRFRCWPAQSETDSHCIRDDEMHEGIEVFCDFDHFGHNYMRVPFWDDDRLEDPETMLLNDAGVKIGIGRYVQRKGQ